MLFNKLIFLNQTPVPPTPPVTLNRVGGKIFYIDSTATGATYTFYDQQENVISDVQVGDEPYYYSVEGTGDKDKFYAFNFDAQLDQKLWTYFVDGSCVLNDLGTSTSFGSGRNNTNIVLSADGGKYGTEDTNWKQLLSLRTSELGGCNDWYMPSRDELLAVNNAVDREGNKITDVFNNYAFDTSSEYGNASVYTWSWYHDMRASYKQYAAFKILPIRSF